uniref:Uncharacterized protein n=1 Tax=Rhizophora mucronata TaxID=61149 RepID=A0A2P2P3J5_RHIMU
MSLAVYSMTYHIVSHLLCNGKDTLFGTKRSQWLQISAFRIPLYPASTPYIIETCSI